MGFSDDLHRFGPGTSNRLDREEALLYCAAHCISLREFQRRDLADSARTSPGVSRHLRVLPMVRRPGRRDRRSAAVARALSWWRGELQAMYQGRARHPVMIALMDTVERYRIPVEPFEALISAFEQDQTTLEYLTYPELLDYCTRSANPVGHLVLSTRRRLHARERSACRRDLHRAATGQLLARRRPRPENWPHLLAS